MGVGQHDPSVVGDEDGAGVDVAVDDAGRVQRGDGLGDRVGDQDGAFGVERRLAEDVAQGDPGDPLAHHVGAVALIDSVVHTDDVRVSQPARGDRRGQHVRRRLASGLAYDQGDGPAQHRVGALPDLTTRGVCVDVFVEAIAFAENLAGGGCAEGHHTGNARRSTTGHGMMPFAVVAHPLLLYPGCV